MSFPSKQNHLNGLNQLPSKKLLRLVDFQALDTQKFKADAYSLDYDNKFINSRHRTVQCSPARCSPIKDTKSCLPQLNTGDKIMKHRLNKLTQLNSKQSKNICILDSLIKLLKDDDQIEKIRPVERYNLYRASTEGTNEFKQSCTQRKNKKPKIINNQVTRLLFEEPSKQRRLFSEEGTRKGIELSEKIDSTTFYKNKRKGFELKVQSPFESKQQLQLFTQTRALTRRFK